jgi:lipopolysaccharide/colanic/teichoic acid biosynthesis glycosyltransferase
MSGGELAKRCFDIIAAAILLVLAVPFLACAALMQAVMLRSWPLFSHQRVGREGRLFRFFKLRTLSPDIEPYAPKYNLTFPISRQSAALRRLHLDELPQLGLVLLGRMSLVGPRPEMPNLHRLFSDEFAAARTAVRPGCTGLWQISEHCATLIHEHPELDAFYLMHRGLRLDLWILAKTVRLLVPIGDRRLVSLDDVPLWAMRTEPRSVPLASVIDRVEPSRGDTLLKTADA